MKIDQIPLSTKEGDVVSCVIANTEQFFIIKNNQLLTLDGRHPCFILDHFKADWKIIPAEPKVLTAEEIENKFEDGSTVMDIIEYARQNYRLERDLEFRPLIEVTEKFISHANGFNYHCDGGGYGFIKSWHESFTNALEDLKPLNDE